MFAVTTHDYTPLEERGLNSAKIIAGADSLYYGYRRGVNATIKVLIYVPLYLLALLFAAWMNHQRRMLQKRLRVGLPSFETPEEYKRLRMKYEDINQYKSSLIKYSKYDLSKIPWLLRFTVKQIKKTSVSVLTLLSAIEKKLNAYNVERFPLNNKKIRLRTEEELWSSRPKSYSYIM